MRYIIASAVALVCASCSPTPAPPTPQTPPAAALPTSPQEPIITQIVSRNEVLIVRAGPTEPTYSVQTKSGEILVPAMIAGHLAQAHPELLEKVRTMQAGAMDASADSQ